MTHSTVRELAEKLFIQQSPAWEMRNAKILSERCFAMAQAFETTASNPPNVEFKKDFDSIDQAVKYCEAQTDPQGAIIAVVSNCIKGSDFNFASDILEAWSCA